MEIRKNFLAVIVATVAPTMLFAAQDWQIGSARGLPTYAINVEGGSILLVCDPDRVYNPDVSTANLVVTMPQASTAAQIVFLSVSGAQAAFDVRDGISTQQAARPTDWAALVEMIQQGGPIAVVTAREMLTFDMKPMPDLVCD